MDLGVVEAGPENLGTEKQIPVSPGDSRSGCCGQRPLLSRASHSRCPADMVSPHHGPASPQVTPEVLDTRLEQPLSTSSEQHGRSRQELHASSPVGPPETPNISTLWSTVGNGLGTSRKPGALPRAELALELVQLLADASVHLALALHLPHRGDDRGVVLVETGSDLGERAPGELAGKVHRNLPGV